MNNQSKVDESSIAKVSEYIEDLGRQKRCDWKRKGMGCCLEESEANRRFACKGRTCAESSRCQLSYLELQTRSKIGLRRLCCMNLLIYFWRWACRILAHSMHTRALMRLQTYNLIITWMKCAGSHQMAVLSELLRIATDGDGVFLNNRV